MGIVHNHFVKIVSYKEPHNFCLAVNKVKVCYNEFTYFEQEIQMQSDGNSQGCYSQYNQLLTFTLTEYVKNFTQRPLHMFVHNICLP